MPLHPADDLGTQLQGRLLAIEILMSLIVATRPDPGDFIEAAGGLLAHARSERMAQETGIAKETTRQVFNVAGLSIEEIGAAAQRARAQ